MSTSTSPKLPYIPVMELPLLVRKNILVQADNESFAKWCSYPQFAPLCGTNYNAQQVYKERCERLLDDKILGFKNENVSWRDFYYLVSTLNTDIKRGVFSTANYDMYHQLKVYGKLKNGFILLNIISVIFPAVFERFKILLLNDMLGKEKIETAEWLLNFTTITDIYENVISDAYHYGRDNLINFLIEKGVTPTQDNINSLADEDNLEIIKELNKNYGYLPDAYGLYLAIERDDREMVKWLLEKYVPISENSVQLAIDQDNLPVMLMLVNYGAKISRQQYDDLERRSDLKDFFMQYPEYIRE